MVIATLLRLKGRQKDEYEILEIHNGLSELFDLDLCAERFESLQTKISNIREPVKLNYLIQLLALEMENEALQAEGLLLRRNLLDFTKNHLEAKYTELKITTFFGQSKS